MDALVEIAGEQLTRYLVGMLEDPSDVVRRFAIGALCKVKDPKALGALVRCAQSESDWWVRELAIQAAAALGDARAVPYLARPHGARARDALRVHRRGADAQGARGAPPRRLAAHRQRPRRATRRGEGRRRLRSPRRARALAGPRTGPRRPRANRGARAPREVERHARPHRDDRRDALVPRPAPRGDGPERRRRPRRGGGSHALRQGACGKHAPHRQRGALRGAGPRGCSSRCSRPSSARPSTPSTTWISRTRSRAPGSASAATSSAR